MCFTPPATHSKFSRIHMLVNLQALKEIPRLLELAGIFRDSRQPQEQADGETGR